MNDTLERLNEDLRGAAQYTKNPEPIVVRAYSTKIDMKIYQHETEKARLTNPNIPKQPPLIQEDALDVKTRFL